MSKRGALVVIEGLDRSGKTTQCARLLAKLEAAGIRAELIKLPGECCARRLKSRLF
jgi:dTMP kinase